jgi:hypothetical protein
VADQVAVVCQDASGGAPKVKKAISTCTTSPGLSANQCTFMSIDIKCGPVLTVIDQSVCTEHTDRVPEMIKKIQLQE